MRTKATGEGSPRDRILKAASRLFYTEGIKATGIDKVVAESKVAKMTLYSYFPSKQDLVLEYLNLSGNDWLGWFQARVNAAPVEKRPLALFDVMEEWVSEAGFRGCYFINAAVESSDPGAVEKKVAKATKQAVFEYVESVVRAAGYPQAKRLAEQLFLLMDGVIVRAHVDGNSKYAKVAKQMAQGLLKA